MRKKLSSVLKGKAMLNNSKRMYLLGGQLHTGQCLLYKDNLFTAFMPKRPTLDSWAFLLTQHKNVYFGKVTTLWIWGTLFISMEDWPPDTKQTTGSLQSGSFIQCPSKMMFAYCRDLTIKTQTYSIHGNTPIIIDDWPRGSLSSPKQNISYESFCPYLGSRSPTLITHSSH